MNVTLQSNEGIHSYHEEVTYVYDGKNINGTLYVTNLQLIFVQCKGVFQKQYVEYTLPFSQFKIINDKVQMIIKEDRKEKIIEMTICMKRGIEKFEFDWSDRSVVYTIADEISKILTSSLYERPDIKRKSVAYKVGNFIKHGVSSFTDGLFGREKKAITKKCKVCKAEIKGIQGEETTCKFCGSTQKL